MKKQLLLLLSFVVSGMFAPVYLYAGEKKAMPRITEFPLQ